MKLLSFLPQKTEEVYVELRGRSSVLLQGYARIEEYSESLIRLGGSNDRLCIRGENLYLRHISSDRVAIDGRIDGIEFCEA